MLTSKGKEIVLIDVRATLLAHGAIAPTLAAYAEKYQVLLASLVILHLGTTIEALAHTYTQAIRFEPIQIL